MNLNKKTRKKFADDNKPRNYAKYAIGEIALEPIQRINVRYGPGSLRIPFHSGEQNHPTQPFYRS